VNQSREETRMRNREMMKVPEMTVGIPSTQPRKVEGATSPYPIVKIATNTNQQLFS
jgi:hypothetical protein